MNEINWGVENVDFSCGNCYTNIHTLSEAKNHNSIYYTNKGYEKYPNLSAMENTGWQDGV